MDEKPLAAPAASALARRGLTKPSADAPAARVPAPLRASRRTATACWRASHSAGAAAAADAAWSSGATVQGALRGGRDRGGADSGGKLAAVGAGTGVVATAGAGAAAGSTQSGRRPRCRHGQRPPNWAARRLVSLDIGDTIGQPMLIESQR